MLTCGSRGGRSSRENEGSVSKEVNAAKAKGEGRVVVIVTGSNEIDPNTLIGGNSADRQRVTQLQALAEKLQNAHLCCKLLR